jgi:hypothetical protein
LTPPLILRATALVVYRCTVSSADHSSISIRPSFPLAKTLGQVVSSEQFRFMRDVFSSHFPHSFALILNDISPPPAWRAGTVRTRTSVFPNGNST